MSKKEKKPKQETGGEKPQEGRIPGIPLIIHAQYIRDISFENPGAPLTLRGGQTPPKIQIAFNMDAHPMEDGDLKDMHEVVLSVRADARREEEVIFIAEVQYGITVSVKEVPEERRHALLLIEVPRLAFPFVRQIMSDLTLQGGFPPLLLQPVNFHKLYMDKFGKDPEEEAENTKH